MASVTTRARKDRESEDAIPPLENGDRLSRTEFERRHHAMPGLKKAELIEGVVYMPSPVRYESHGHPHGLVVTWLGVYWAGTPGTGFADNASARLDARNEPQPDAVLMIKSGHGGKARISADDYIEGAPELAVEVSSSSVSIDLNLKFEVYRRTGVREYVVWRVLDEQIDWFMLRDGQFVRLDSDENGHYRSHVFPGLWLDPAAMIRGELTTVLDLVRRGLASPEHDRFVEYLTASGEKGAS